MSRPAAQPSSRARRLTFFVVVTGSVLASLDLFIVNIAFGSIGASFPDAGSRELAWVLNAYGIAFAALLVPFGRIADTIGRKRVFAAGLIVFVVASAVCAVAPSLLVLVAARAVQGAGAAAVIPTSLGLLLSSAPSADHKRLVSIWAATGSIAAALGPTAGGLLVQFGWRWIFLITVVLAAPALALVGRVRAQPGRGGRLPDLLGSAALALSAGLLVWVVSYSSDPDTTVLGLSVAAGAAAVLAAVFVWRSRRARVPAVDLRVFAARGFRFASVGMLFFYAAFGIMLVSAPLVLTGALGLPPALAGLAFGAGPAAAVVSTLVAGRLPATPRTLGVLGGALFAAGGAWWLAVLVPTGSLWWGYVPGILLTGLGAGVAQTSFIAGGTASLPAAEYSAGAGILNTGRQIGSALGVAVFVAVTAVGAHTAAVFAPAWAVMSAAGALALLAALCMGGRTSTAADIAQLESSAG